MFPRVDVLVSKPFSFSQVKKSFLSRLLRGRGVAPGPHPSHPAQEALEGGRGVGGRGHEGQEGGWALPSSPLLLSRTRLVRVAVAFKQHYTHLSSEIKCY